MDSVINLTSQKKFEKISRLFALPLKTDAFEI